MVFLKRERLLFSINCLVGLNIYFFLINCSVLTFLWWLVKGFTNNFNATVSRITSQCGDHGSLIATKPACGLLSSPLPAPLRAAYKAVLYRTTTGVTCRLNFKRLFLFLINILLSPAKFFFINRKLQILLAGNPDWFLAPTETVWRYDDWPGPTISFFNYNFLRGLHCQSLWKTSQIRNKKAWNPTSNIINQLFLWDSNEQHCHWYQHTT